MSNIKVARFLSHIRVVRLQECEMLFPHSPEPIWWLCWPCLICNGKYVVNGFAVRVRYRMDLSLTGFRMNSAVQNDGESGKKGKAFLATLLCKFCCNIYSLNSNLCMVTALRRMQILRLCIVSVPTFRESLHVTGDCVEILLSVKDGPPSTSTKESLELRKNDVVRLC